MTTRCGEYEQMQIDSMKHDREWVEYVLSVRKVVQSQKERVAK